MEAFKDWFYNFSKNLWLKFTDDFLENLIIIAVGIFFGRLGAPWLF